MLEWVYLAAEWQCFPFAFGCGLFQGVCLHGQFIQFFGIGLRFGICRGAVSLTHYNRITAEASFIKLNRLDYLPNLMAIRIPSRHLGAIWAVSILGHHDFLPNKHTFNVFDAEQFAIKFDFQIRSHTRLFWCRYRKFSTMLSWWRKKQMFSLYLVPALIAGHAVSAVYFGCIEIAHPFFRISV